MFEQRSEALLRECASAEAPHMPITRAKLAWSTLALVLALGACFAAGASAATPNTARHADAAVRLERAHTRQVSRLTRRIAVLNSHVAFFGAVAARGIAGRTRLLEEARKQLLKMQERGCPLERSCEAKTARMELLQAHILLIEERVKAKELAWQSRLARFEEAKHLAEESLAHL